MYGSGQGGDTKEACISKCDSMNDCCAFMLVPNWGQSGVTGEHVCVINRCLMAWETSNQRKSNGGLRDPPTRLLFEGKTCKNLHHLADNVSIEFCAAKTNFESGTTAKPCFSGGRNFVWSDHNGSQKCGCC